MIIHLLPVSIVFALTLSVLLSSAQADHSDHNEGGSQGGNVNPIGAFYETCAKGKATCVGAVRDGSKKTSDCYSKKNCDYMVAIAKHDKEYKFSLFGKVEQDAGYVAVGISEDGTKMINSSIVECRGSTSSEQDNRMVVSWSYKSVKPEVLGEETTSFIKPIDHPHIYNGMIVCEFHRDASSIVKGYHFDLDTKKYKILLAIGGLKDGVIYYHGVEDRVLSTPMNLSTPNGSSKIAIPAGFLVLCLMVMGLH